MPFKPLREDEEVIRYRDHLPHWRQEAVTYFVTFRLRDSIPQSKLRIWAHERECWRASHGLKTEDSIDDLPEEARPEYHRLFTKAFHDWLDAGMGECILKRGNAARVVADAMLHFHGDRYDLNDWVIMPNHVHVLDCPQREHPLERVLHSWKSYTAHEINKLFQRKGTLWQHESYDHIVRSEEQLDHYRRYIRDNPVKARLSEGEYLLSESR